MCVGRMIGRLDPFEAWSPGENCGARRFGDRLWWMHCEERASGFRLQHAPWGAKIHRLDVHPTALRRPWPEVLGPLGRCHRCGAPRRARMETETGRLHRRGQGAVTATGMFLVTRAYIEITYRGSTSLLKKSRCRKLAGGWMGHQRGWVLKKGESRTTPSVCKQISTRQPRGFSDLSAGPGQKI